MPVRSDARSAVRPNYEGSLLRTISSSITGGYVDHLRTPSPRPGVPAARSPGSRRWSGSWAMMRPAARPSRAALRARLRRPLTERPSLRAVAPLDSGRLGRPRVSACEEHRYEKSR